MMRSSSAIRPAFPVREYVEKAARAAFTARSTSAAAPRLIWATGSSVAGLITSRVRGSIGSTHAPSMLNFALLVMAAIALLHRRVGP